MNTTEQGILALMKSAITQQPCRLPEDFVLEQAMPLIRRHNMATLAYDGAARCGIPLQDPAMQDLFRSYCKAVVVCERQQKELRRICEAFDRQQIDYMLLKGSRIRPLYPKPELRLMGDADILIRMEQYDKIVPILESLGFAYGAETVHELVWKTDGLYLELHKSLIPSYNKDFYSYFGDGWDLAKNCGGTRYAMTAEDEWIYLFTHFAKHYRDGGIGLRHVADLWVWRRSHPAMDEAYIHTAMEKLHLDVFQAHILRLLDHWFAEGQPDEILGILSACLFFSGSFGTAELQTLSWTIRDAKKEAPGCSGRLVYLKNMAFPSVKTLEGKYTILKKAPWMLPAVWVVRPFYKVLFERRSLLNRTENLKYLTREKLDLRREMLLAVGLDYHM